MATYQSKLYVGGVLLSQENTANRIASWDGMNWASAGSGLNGTVNAYSSIFE